MKSQAGREEKPRKEHSISLWSLVSNVTDLVSREDEGRYEQRVKRLVALQGVMKTHPRCRYQPLLTSRGQGVNGQPQRYNRRSVDAYLDVIIASPLLSKDFQLTFPDVPAAGDDKARRSCVHIASDRRSSKSATNAGGPGTTNTPSTMVYWSSSKSTLAGIHGPGTTNTPSTMD